MNQQNQENKQNINIHINNEVRGAEGEEPSAEVSDADHFVEPCIVLREAVVEEIQPVQSMPILHKNPLLNVIKPVRAHKDMEINVDVDFLKHTIKTILSNDNVSIDNKDVGDILGYFGSVVIVSNKELVQNRDVKNKGLCCNVDEEEVISVIKKVCLNGYNIIKYLPDLVDF
jgi:hypothetical protein